MSRLFANLITEDFLTSRGGLDIGKKIENQLLQNPFDNIEISFSGVTNVSPSFVNGAFLYLIDNYGSDYFRSHVKVTNATSEVAKTIGDSVRIYLDRQKIFFNTLKVNKLFFASDGSEQGDALIHELKKISVENGFKNITTTDNIQSSLFGKNLIENSDALIGILTDNKYENNIGRQIEIAIKANKPCILLLHNNINFRLPTNSHEKIHVIYYDDKNYLEKLKALNKIISDCRKEDPNTNLPHLNNSSPNSEAAFAVIAIALLAALLFIALASNKNKEDRF
jgi:hypothetical protein